MKLSVVIPFWNSERWVANAIESVLGQGVRTEIIAVDDGSSDRGFDVARRYAPAVTVIRQANAGVSAARNRGLSEATGDYVVFLDADDRFEGDVLSGVAVATAGGADITFSRSASESGPLRREHDHRLAWPRIGPMGIARDIANGRTVAVHAQAFARPMLLRLGGYRLGEVSTQDTELLLRALLLGATVGFNDAGTAMWTLRPRHDGLSTRRDLAMLASAHAWHRDHLATLPMSDEIRQAYALRSYALAGQAFEGGHRALGREAMALARGAGLRGHPGGRAHVLVASAIGLERKIVLARGVRRARAAVGFPKKSPGSSPPQAPNEP